MDTEFLAVTVADGVATVLINRPDKGNALSPAVLQQIGDVFGELDARTDVSVIVFTGGQKIFSAGFDLDYLRTVDQEDNQAFIALFHRAYRSIMFCSQPVIAAIEGSAVAGGFDLTMVCDIRYASERSKFSQREAMLSLTPLLDPLWRIVGLGVAKEWALTAKMIDAQEALRVGFVNQVFPDGSVLENVMTIARQMASYDRTCLVETKKLSIELLGGSLESSMKTQEWLFRSILGTESNHARIDALLERLRAGKKG
jgi:enoyl-CoA hydratase/carnithine racemase